MLALETAAILGLGLLAGLHHAATGPDHLAGVAPLAAGAGRAAWRVGAAWGLGHACGAGLAALLALCLRSSLSGVEQHVSAISETLVGVLLCAIGFFGLVAVARAHVHRHEHGPLDERAGLRHEHAHVHWFGLHAGDRHAEHARHGHSAFALGLFHGAAGLAHLFGVLPALALPGIVLPASYLAGYASGSLAAIVAFASAVGWVGRGRRAPRGWLAVTSAASLAIGAWWVLRAA